MPKINAAIQLLPTKCSADRIALIDNAIARIHNSGLLYKVCPFETVVEGEPEAVFALIEDIRKDTLSSGCEELLINIKIHAATQDLHFQDKLEKYT